MPRAISRHRTAAALAPLLLALGAPLPAAAHHRQTPPIVRMTPTDDAVDYLLPRLPDFDGELAVLAPSGTDEQLITVHLYPSVVDVLEGTGDNADPAVALNGAAIAWDSDSDPLGTGAVGRQVYYHNGTITRQVTDDPTGTSANPAVSGSGQWVAFQSSGDLAGTGTQGGTQLFLYGVVGAGTLRQVTAGAGASTNPALDRRAKSLAFQSTTDPNTGQDTGVSQLWFTNLQGGAPARVTSGLGPSGNPTIDADGKVVAFESQADLAGTGTDTGVPQIFIYSPKTATFAQITNDPGGCTGPSVHKFRSDFRIAYVCSGQTYFTLLRANTRWRVQADVPGSDTTRIVAGFGPYFVLLRTTADLLDGTGITSGHQVYLVNLFKRVPAAVAGSTVWFPQQGIPPLRP